MRKPLNEKFRPPTIDGYIFPNERIEDNFKKWKKHGVFPTVAFFGPAGCGKSTLARILVNEFEVNPSDVKYIAASNISPAEYFREELTPWLKKASIGDFKVVILEECDRIKPETQKMLRILTENYFEHVRFIVTGNYYKQIIPELISRFEITMFESLTEDEILDKVVNIVEEEGIEIDDPEILMSHVSLYTPDLRKIINSIDEATSSENRLREPQNSFQTADLAKWEELWMEGNVKEKFNELLEVTELVDNNNYNWFYEVMYNNHNAFPDPIDAIIKMSTYMDRAGRAANQRLHLEAFLHVVLNDEVGEEG